MRRDCGSSAPATDANVYENVNAYPRAWVVHDVHLVGGVDEAFAFLRARSRREQRRVSSWTRSIRGTRPWWSRGETTDDAARPAGRLRAVRRGTATA